METTWKPEAKEEKKTSKEKINYTENKLQYRTKTSNYTIGNELSIPIKKAEIIRLHKKARFSDTLFIRDLL